jgi:hypothetical protein
VDRRRTRLLVVLAALRHIPVNEPASAALRAWLDNWHGLGLIEGGMARQDYDLELVRFADEGWHATFYVKGREHSLTRYTGSATAETPWHAVSGRGWKRS